MAIENTTKDTRKAAGYVNVKYVSPVNGGTISLQSIPLFDANPNQAKIIAALGDDPDGTRMENFMKGIVATYNSAEPKDVEVDLDATV